MDSLMHPKLDEGTIDSLNISSHKFAIVDRRLSLKGANACDVCRHNKRMQMKNRNVSDVATADRLTDRQTVDTCQNGTCDA